MILKPYVPQEASLHEATYVYMTVERAVLGELSDKVLAWAMDKLGPAWHSSFIENPANFAVKGWIAPGDPFFILKALAKIPYTPLLKALGPGKDLVDHAWDVFNTRNLWAHHSNNQQMSSIKEDILGLVRFAEEAGLGCAKDAKDSLTTLVKLTANAVSLKPKLVATSETATAAIEDKVAPRPHVGSPWTEEFPTEEVELNSKLGDVLDPATGKSLRDRWPTPQEAEMAIQRWFDLKPTVPRLRVDPRDGATIGFLDGYPFLIGYLGAEPETPPEQFRGFLGKATYVLREGALHATGSGKNLALGEEERKKVRGHFDAHGISEGEAFKISNYRDLVHLSDDGPIRILTLETH